MEGNASSSLDQTIIKAVHDKDNPYFLMRRDTAQDTTLSWEARGVITYLLSKPCDWTIMICDLQQNCGRDKVYTILDDLGSHGYLEYVEERTSSGKFQDGFYRLYEVPSEQIKTAWIAFKEKKAKKPHPEKPDTVQPDTAKPTLQIKELDKEKNIQNKDSSSRLRRPGQSLKAPREGEVVEEGSKAKLNYTELEYRILSVVSNRSLSEAMRKQLNEPIKAMQDNLLKDFPSVESLCETDLWFRDVFVPYVFESQKKYARYGKPSATNIIKHLKGYDRKDGWLNWLKDNPKPVRREPVIASAQPELITFEGLS